MSMACSASAYSGLSVFEKRDTQAQISVVHLLSRPSISVELVAAAVAVTEKGARAPFEVIDRERIPFGGVLEPHRHFRVLVIDQLLAGVPTVHADKAIEHQLQVLGGPYQFTGTMIAQASAIQPRGQVEIR
jgi:hypothetical protein